MLEHLVKFKTPMFDNKVTHITFLTLILHFVFESHI